jgi:ferric enterobactin receptor
MMKMKNLLLLCLITLCQARVFAQSKPGRFSVYGTIADSTSQKTMDFVTVNLMKDKTTTVKVDYSKADGSFSFTQVEAGKYQLVIVGIGYRTKRLDLSLVDTLNVVVKLGTVNITPEVIGLKEVKVTAIKPVVRQEVDRLVYDLQADPESKTYSVLEMMRKVPLLSLDADNNLLMKGNSDFRILINGKPSSMMERSYKDVLRSMPASSIERIEVITSPPAKYDAEGLAGIINIITNKKIDNGYNGSLNISERFPVGGPGVGGSVSAKLGKLGISGYGGANIYNNPEIRNTINRATFGLEPTQLSQQGFNKSNNRNGYLGLEMSYEIDSLNLISIQLNTNASRSSGRARQSTSLTDVTEMLQGFRLDNENRGNGNGMDASFNYQKGFRADKNRLLTLSYRRFSYSNIQNAELNVTERVNYNLPDYRQLNDQHFAEQTFQLDYVHPWKKLQIEAGVKGILRNNNSDFQYLVADALTGQYTLQQGSSNRFRNTQNVFGAYNSYQYNFKKWGVKAGVRIEETVIDADFISTESAIKRTYFNVIPSVSLNRKLKKNRGITLAYTQRIQRPGIYQLNPFVDRSNPNFERTGNPDLRPALVNDLQLSYTRPAKATLNVGLGFNYFRDLFFPVSVYDSTTNITRTSFGNTGTAKLPMVYVNINYPVTKKWNLSLNGRAAYGMVQGNVNGIKVKNQGLMYNVSLSTGYKLQKEWRVNANFNLNGPSVQFQGTSNIMFNTSASVSKDIVKDKLSFSAGVNNPFTKFRRNYNYTFGPDFEQNNNRWDYFRTFNVSLNYKFGKLKESIKRNRRGIRNDDVQGGN